MEQYAQLLETLLAEEDSIQFQDFSNALALQVGMRLVEVVSAENKSVTVDICRNGQQLFHCALPGTSADNDAWIQRKNRVVNRLGHSSYYVGVYCKSQQTTIEEKYLLDSRDYAAHGGAFPIIIRDTGVIGTVTVSGLPQEEDHALVVRVLREFCDRTES